MCRFNGYVEHVVAQDPALLNAVSTQQHTATVLSDQGAHAGMQLKSQRIGDKVTAIGALRPGGRRQPVLAPQVASLEIKIQTSLVHQPVAPVPAMVRKVQPDGTGSLMPLHLDDSVQVGETGPQNPRREAGDRSTEVARFHLYR